jgi:hypothetical protein
VKLSEALLKRGGKRELGKHRRKWLDNTKKKLNLLMISYINGLL